MSGSTRINWASSITKKRRNVLNNYIKQKYLSIIRDFQLKNLYSKRKFRISVYTVWDSRRLYILVLFIALPTLATLVWDTIYTYLLSSTTVHDMRSLLSIKYKSTVRLYQEGYTNSIYKRNFHLLKSRTSFSLTEYSTFERGSWRSGSLRTVRLNSRTMRNTRTVCSRKDTFTLDTRKVKVLSLPETIKEKSTFRAKALRRKLVVSSKGLRSKRRCFLYRFK